MAGRWRVLVDGVEDLTNPRYRIGDTFRHVKHTLAHDDELLKELVIEVGHDGDFQATKQFGVPASGSARIGAVLWVRSPPAGQQLVFRVVKAHKIQKDALIGEARVAGVCGRRKLELFRHDKPRGYLLVDVNDGLPPPVPGSAAAAAAAASTPNSKTSLPLAALRHPAPAATASGGGGGGGLSALLSPCFGCATGALVMLGLRDDQAMFLNSKRHEPSVVKLPSGLMYRVLKRGGGHTHPTLASWVDCHYKGMFVNGKVFDSSDGRGPQQFQVSGVVKAWTEALQQMVEGDQWELFVPPHLGYGEAGCGPIPPNTALWFHVELLRIKGGNGGGAPGRR